MSESKEKVQERKIEDSGHVEVRVANPKRLGRINIRTISHPETDEIIEVVDNAGREIAYPITKSIQILDLSKKKDRSIYEALKVHPITRQGVLKLRHIEQSAEEEVEKTDSIFEALRIVKEDIKSDVELATFARLLGINPNGLADSSLKQKVFDVAKNSPEKLINEWEREDREVRQNIMLARSREILRIVDGDWMFNETFLGNSLDIVVGYFRDNPELYSTVKKLTKEKL